MASIDKRSDGRYRARWREYPGGPQKDRHFARKFGAEHFLDAIRGDLAIRVGAIQRERALIWGTLLACSDSEIAYLALRRRMIDYLGLRSVIAAAE